MTDELCAKRRQAMDHINQALRLLDEIDNTAAAAHLALVAELLEASGCSN